MKKKEFLDELDRILTERNYLDKEEALKDFEEHFNVGEQEGKSEEEIAKLLGDPKDIAEQFKQDGEDVEKNTTVVSESKQTANQARTENSPLTKFILAGILIFFNLVFVVGILAGLFGALVGLFVAGVAIFIAGIVTAITGVLGLIVGITFIVSPMISLALMFAGIGVTSLRSAVDNGNGMDQCMVI